MNIGAVVNSAFIFPRHSVPGDFYFPNRTNINVSYSLCQNIVGFSNKEADIVSSFIYIPKYLPNTHPHIKQPLK